MNISSDKKLRANILTNYICRTVVNIDTTFFQTWHWFIVVSTLSIRKELQWKWSSQFSATKLKALEILLGKLLLTIKYHLLCKKFFFHFYQWNNKRKCLRFKKKKILCDILSSVDVQFCKKKSLFSGHWCDQCISYIKNPLQWSQRRFSFF